MIWGFIRTSNDYFRRWWLIQVLNNVILLFRLLIKINEKLSTQELLALRTI